MPWGLATSEGLEVSNLVRGVVSRTRGNWGNAAREGLDWESVVPTSIIFSILDRREKETGKAGGWMEGLVEGSEGRAETWRLG